MAVDADRVQAVFRLALAAGTPVEQAAILDRECASDVELRRTVEALLRAYQEPAAVLGQPPAVPREPVSSPSDRTVISDGSADQQALAGSSSSQDDITTRIGPVEEEAKSLLPFLKPSAKKESLGRLGHYEVLEVLGHGAFGIVVRAYDEVLQRVVAIKVLSPRLASTSPARKRFLREARSAGRIRHENVVQIHAVEEAPLPYLVMEYIPGETLQDKLDELGPLEVKEVLRIGEQIARGLAAAHEQGLIHRDIKPGNILLESRVGQKVKITDFGLARAADDASVSQSGVIAGTPLYMAPEQARGEPLDHRLDLFSLGSVLYTMTSGRPPFRAPTALAVLKRVAEDTPRPIPEIIPEVPQWLCDLIGRLHAKDPAKRFQSAADVADLLARHLAHLPQPSLQPRPDFADAPRPATLAPRRLVLVASAAGLLALGAALTYPLWHSSRQAPTTAALPADSSPPAPQQAASLRPTAAAATVRNQVLQGRTAVRSALLDFDEPERNFSAVPQDNALRRGEQCNTLLVRFDLAKLGLSPKSRPEKATVRFYVWDPSSQGRTKVCAFPLTTDWDQATANWRQAAAGKPWRGGASFAFGADTGPAGASVVVEPEQGMDTVDPPIEYQLDVTDLVSAWLEGRTPNFGLAIAPVIDPAVDEGFRTRFQVYGLEHNRAEFTPKLVMQMRP